MAHLMTQVVAKVISSESSVKPDLACINLSGLAALSSTYMGLYAH